MLHLHSLSSASAAFVARFVYNITSSCFHYFTCSHTNKFTFKVLLLTNGGHIVFGKEIIESLGKQRLRGSLNSLSFELRLNQKQAGFIAGVQPPSNVFLALATRGTVG